MHMPWPLLCESLHFQHLAFCSVNMQLLQTLGLVDGFLSKAVVNLGAENMIDANGILGIIQIEAVKR